MAIDSVSQQAAIRSASPEPRKPEKAEAAVSASESSSEASKPEEQKREGDLAVA